MTELIQQLEQTDAQIFLFFNGFHNEYWDYFMYMFSNAKTWIPLYLGCLFVMIRNYPIKTSITTLLIIALIVTLCDQTTSGLLKPMVCRMRPSNLSNPLSSMVHVVQGYRGGAYGFPSSHASNTWGISLFAIYLLRRKPFSIFLCLWALVTCYSRMYLGVHYFGDILVGSVIGIIYATAAYLIYKRNGKTYVESFQPPQPIRYAYIPILVGCMTIVILLGISGWLCLYPS